MKIKNIIRRSLVAASVMMVTLTTSCNDWLNVQPTNQQAATELFSTEAGFKAALSGIYTIMAETSLYGREATFATVGIIGGEYIPGGQTSFYSDLYDYNFEGSNATQYSDAIWSRAYFAIANINDMLAFIDENKSVFLKEENYSIIKGEALALRAYIHLDMLRLFAPYTFTGNIADKAFIPYVDEYVRTTAPALTNAAFMEMVMKDINDAIELLKADPIYTGDDLKDTYFVNRHFHINYYAAVALKARAALYANDKTTAKNAAEEVLEAQAAKGLFPWVLVEDVTNPTDANRDRTFTTEHLFSLNVRDMGQNITSYFTSPVTYTELKLVDPEFDGIATDYRAQFVNNDGYTTKFNQPDPTSIYNSNLHLLRRMPMLRITEMYYILAECDNDMTRVETVRLNRGIDEDIEPTLTVLQALEAEYTKEFIGEGQKFYFHKRHNHSSIAGVSNVKYVLYMPINEIDFGGRPRP